MLQKVPYPEEHLPSSADKKYSTPLETNGKRETTSSETKSLPVVQDRRSAETETKSISPKIASEASVDNDQEIEWQPECRPEEVAFCFEEAVFEHNKSSSISRPQITGPLHPRISSGSSDKTDEVRAISPATKRAIGLWGKSMFSITSETISVRNIRRRQFRTLIMGSVLFKAVVLWLM